MSEGMSLLAFGRHIGKSMPVDPCFCGGNGFPQSLI